MPAFKVAVIISGYMTVVANTSQEAEQKVMCMRNPKMEKKDITNFKVTSRTVEKCKEVILDPEGVNITTSSIIT